ncbi:hypothetical protein [Streptomyces novaecaesareae]|uniref:hypothetical protein n=1 Tax=Streptomyces novaecaesareae TaxID=68244 RepID=UPI0004AA8951|nr:hypothetical protein [Streptomyces novaecaesareae]
MAECRTADRPWLIGPRADAWFVFGLGGLFSLVLYLCWRAGDGFLVVAAVFAVLVDFPHVLWTSLRVLLDPDERERNGRHYLVSLAVILAAVGGLTVAGRFDVVLTVFVGWQVLHVVKQHIGMVSVYAARAQSRRDRRPAKYLLIAGCSAPVLYRLSEGLHLGHYVIAGRPLPFSDAEVLLPPVPVAVVVLGYALFGVALVRFVVDEVRSAERLPGIALATIGVALTFYNLSYVLVSDPYALILIATTFHGFQYHVISWARNRGRFAGTGSRLLLARLTCPKSVWPLGLALAGVGGALSQGEFVLGGVIPFTIVLHHFYLDGRLWKPAGNPGLARHLALASR